MVIQTGEKIFFKTKKGLYIEVTVRSIQGDYAIIKGGEGIFGIQKVKLSSLVKKPSKDYIDILKEVEKKKNEESKIQR